MTTPLVRVGILSIGDMGAGIARLLLANNYKVITNVSDRSAATQRRAESIGVDLATSDVDLCNKSDYIMSIVPQRDALSIANRIVAAVNDKGCVRGRPHRLYFLELNAVSPQTARNTAKLFAESASRVKYVDGGIIGGPPKLQEDKTWSGPRLVVSGPCKIQQGPGGDKLAEVINAQHIDENIGSASALKMCFAAMSKGFAAIAIQSFSTAQRFGVVDNLQELLGEYNPAFAKSANKMLPNMPPKAYRWVQEMLEIADTFETDGHFSKDENIFRPVSEVYKLVADGTELGKEQTENRQRGKTAEDVATLMVEGLDRRV